MHCLYGTFTLDTQSFVCFTTLYLLVWFDNNKFSGQIPPEIGSLSSLIELRLHSNELTGPLPEEIGNLASLEDLFIHKNSLNGTLPSSLVKFANSQTLEFFDIGHNTFTGPIPDSLWNISSLVHLDLQGNHLTGIVPNDFCNENLSSFEIDGSSWFFVEPKVNCTCCDEPISCILWNITDDPDEDMQRPLCPSENIFSVEFFDTFTIVDVITNSTFEAQFGEGFHRLDACMSPIGCYNVNYQISLVTRNTVKESHFETFNLSYSASSNLQIQQDECDTVKVCGVNFDWNDPRREILNHIVQITFPNLALLEATSSPDSRALCWIMTQDPLLDRYSVCDGTLLQRYVLALFFFSKQDTIDFDSFASNHTCEWKGITCDPSSKFVEHISLSNSSLTGTLITEIGLLARLRTINLAWNQLNGTLDPIMFHNFRDLVTFDIGHNRLRGQLPKELFKLPQLKKVNLTNNMFIGKLPDDVVYSRTLGE